MSGTSSLQDFSNEVIALTDIEAFSRDELGIQFTGNANHDGWMPCHAVDRTDNKPSAAVNIHSGWYKDLGTDESLPYFDLMSKCRPDLWPDWRTAREGLAERAGIPDPSNHGAHQQDNSDASTSVSLSDGMFFITSDLTQADLLDPVGGAAAQADDGTLKSTDQQDTGKNGKKPSAKKKDAKKGPPSVKELSLHQMTFFDDPVSLQIFHGLTSEWCASKPGIDLHAVLAAKPRDAFWSGGQRVMAFKIWDMDHRSNKLREVGYLMYRLPSGIFPAVGSLHERKTHLLRGSRRGVVFRTRAEWEGFAEASSVAITEGTTDMLSTSSWLHGYTVVSLSHGASTINRNKDGRRVAKMFKGKDVVIVADRDSAGTGSAEAAAQVLLEEGAASVRIVDISLGKEVKKGYDLRDFTVEHGNHAADRFDECLANAEPVEADESPKLILPNDCNGDPLPNRHDDDPSSIAAMALLENYNDGDHFKHYQGEDWEYVNGIFRPLTQSESLLRTLGQTQRIIERRHIHDLKNWQQSPASDHQAPPTMPKVGRHLASDVLAHMRSRNMIPSTAEVPTIINMPHDEAVLDWSDTGSIIVTRNGLVYPPNIGTPNLSFCDHDPAVFATNKLSFDYDPTATCPRWLEFLAQLWPLDVQARETLRECFAYTLSGDTWAHKMAVIVGPPRSGKSTVTGVWRGLVGPSVTATPSLHDLSGPFGLSGLYGKRLAIVGDARLSRNHDQQAIAGLILRIVGEDPVDINRKYRDPLVGVRLPVRFVWVSNELPALADASGALAARMIVLQTEQSFLGHEDPQLLSHLLAELPGILNWALAGRAALYERRRFIQPPSGQSLLDEIRSVTSEVGEFVREWCELDPTASVTKDDLYQAWQRYAARNGIVSPGSKSTFSTRLFAAASSVKPARPRTDGIRSNVFNGIRVKPEFIPWNQR